MSGQYSDGRRFLGWTALDHLYDTCENDQGGTHSLGPTESLVRQQCRTDHADDEFGKNEDPEHARADFWWRPEQYRGRRQNEEQS